MQNFFMPFKNLKPLLPLCGLSVLFLVSCATRPEAGPLPPGLKELAGRWEAQAPLCLLPAEKFKALVQESPKGAFSSRPLELVKLFESVNWKKENTLRTELKSHFLKLPANVSDADYALLVRVGCTLSPFYSGASAIISAEASQTKKLPRKRSMKALENYVSVSPSWSIVELMRQWMLLRELSISNHYAPRMPKALLLEMDAFSNELQKKRGDLSKQSEPRNNFDAYTRLREDAKHAFEMQASYDAILRKLRPVFFR